MASQNGGPSREQALAALARANEVRLARAAARRTMTVDQALALIRPDAWQFQGMRIDYLLMGLPGWGKSKVAQLCLAAGTRTSTRLSNLAPHQRERLTFALRLHREGKSPAQAIHALRATKAETATEERHRPGRRDHSSSAEPS